MSSQKVISSSNLPPSSLPDQMNVCWHRPSQKSLSLYVRNLQNVKKRDRGGCAISQPAHNSGPITRVNIKGTTRDLCHLPTYQYQGEFAIKFERPAEKEEKG